MELRDQPILDQYQGAVFRKPLENKIILLGPPGSGKTTTLIRRLAQKRSNEGLSEDEHRRLRQFGLEETLADSWVMFSPTELLKLYVKEAFSREGVPAPGWNLRTWDEERLSLGRDVFRFLKSATGGRYTLAENNDTLLDATSSSIAALHDDFAPAVDRGVIEQCTSAFLSLSQSTDKDSQHMIRKMNPRYKTTPLTLDAIHAFANENEILRARISALSSQIEQESNSLANTLLAPKPIDRLRALADVLGRETAGVSESPDLEDEDDLEGDDVLDLEDRQVDGGEQGEQARTARALIGHIQRLGVSLVTKRSIQSRRFSTIDKWIGNRVLPQEQLIDLGKKVQARKQVRTLEAGARALVFSVPRQYARFRRQCFESGKWFRKESAKFPSKLAPAEADILLLVMLRQARRARSILENKKWLKPIEDRYLIQVMVDEATDFSSVQLAATTELSHPRFRSWLACGDFRQRITREGVSSADEVRWIQNTSGIEQIDLEQIKTDYRQSPKLHALAKALTAGNGERNTVTTEDPDPLLVENISGTSLASWLAGRILEVERTIGKLPSIAVFVDGDDQIEPLVKSLRPILRASNIKIVGCHEGRVVGNEQEVRVFDIQYIKGLEFEAVFLISIDALAKRLPDLFDRFVYVGVTRAATFLGITCATSLPSGLEPVRGFFSSEHWS
jgi:hypothetical protein